jgi:hypothetical protein
MPLLFWYPIIIWSGLCECAITHSRSMSDAEEERHSDVHRATGNPFNYATEWCSTMNADY